MKNGVLTIVSLLFLLSLQMTSCSQTSMKNTNKYNKLSSEEESVIINKGTEIQNLLCRRQSANEIQIVFCHGLYILLLFVGRSDKAIIVPAHLALLNVILH